MRPQPLTHTLSHTPHIHPLTHTTTHLHLQFQDPNDLAQNETQLGIHTVHFLQGLYARYPEFKASPLLLMGVSYAGHMVPNIAAALRTANSQGVFHPPINLHGITLGNPWLSPGHQYAAYGAFALGRNLITQQQADSMASEGVTLCNVSLAACHDHGSRATCLNAWRVCQNATFDVIVRSNPGINVYDVTRKCIGPACYDFSAMDTMLRQPGTERLLKALKGWEGICNSKAHEALMPDWAQDYQPLLGELLDAGVRVLVYAGTWECCVFCGGGMGTTGRDCRKAVIVKRL